MENCKLELISKATVVEKIKEYAGRANASYYGCGRLSVCEDLLKFLDTIEVKEVDLEEELSNYIKHYRNKEIGYTLLGIAEHFFELGIKAQKGE